MASDWHPEQKYWHNRETANIGLNSSVLKAAIVLEVVDSSPALVIFLCSTPLFKTYPTSFGYGVYAVSKHKLCSQNSRTIYTQLKDV